jgi:RecA-family ATPase
VHQLWTRGAFGIVGAEPKSWKSWLTLQVAISVASGKPLFKRLPVEKGRAVVFSAEGGKDLVRSRAVALCRALDVDIRALDLEVIDVPSLQLDRERDIDILADVAATRPALLVLDPLRELHAGDENDAAAIAKLLLPLRLLQREFGCAVMLVHHMAKVGADSGGRRLGQRLRGSSALHGAVDSAIYLEPKGEGPAKRVKLTAEHRAALEPEPMTLCLKSLTTATGEAVWLEPVDAAEDDEAQAARQSASQYQKNRARIVAIIREAARPDRDALKSKSAVVLACGMKRTTAFAIVDELLREGVIRHDQKNGFSVVQRG